jgi:hypothetical protein
MLGAGGLILFAYARTWNKTEIVFRIHINEKRVQESTFGESPTFAIWLEEKGTQRIQTVFVTNRAGLGDWEGKTAVPVALPQWFSIQEEQQSGSLEAVADEMAITGATPQPGYFTARVRVTPGTQWICRVEVNLAGDFNDTFKEYDAEKQVADEFKTGQPALLYRAEIEAGIGQEVKPEIEGMCMLDSVNQVQILPLTGITTAVDIFDEIVIQVAKPKPRIL